MRRTGTTFLVFALLALVAPAVTGPVSALAAPLTLPGQVGAAIAYTTPHGTAAWRSYVYAGAPADDYHYAQVILPATFDPDAPTPTVLVVHGATASEENIVSSPGPRKLLDSWLDAGWAVIATREGNSVRRTATGAVVTSNSKWGNQASAAGMADAWAWATTAWTPDPHGFLVYAWSMGGAGAINFVAEAQRRGDPVAGVHIVDGVTNLAYTYAKVPKFARMIRLAYGLPAKTVVDDAAWRSKVDGADGGHDPQKIVTALQPFPLRMSGSPADPTVNRANNSGLLHTTLNGMSWGAELSYVQYGSGHCAVAHFNPTDTTSFFQRALAA